VTGEQRSLPRVPKEGKGPDRGGVHRHAACAPTASGRHGQGDDMPPLGGRRRLRLANTQSAEGSPRRVGAAHAVRSWARRGGSGAHVVTGDADIQGCNVFRGPNTSCEISFAPVMMLPPT
jgi:hypothetical protein